MTGPDDADAGQPDNTATPQQIAALVASLNIPHRGPRTVYEVCPCCGQPTGTYWAIPRGWEPTEGRRKAVTLDRATVEAILNWALSAPPDRLRDHLIAVAEDWLRQDEELRKLRKLAGTARSIASAPDYDEQTLKDALWALAALASRPQAEDGV